MDINQTLKCSAELEATINSLFDVEPHDDSIRVEACRTMCSVAMEHAQSLKILIGAGNLTSAISLSRLQYETFVRAMWILYSATDLMLSKLMDKLTSESEKKANKLPMLSDMLKQLDGKAPKEAVDMLLEFKEYSWKPLSSFVHGGIHAIHRHSKGYPLPLLATALKASNGVLIMTGMLLIILSKDPSKKGKIVKIQSRFADCLPDIKNKDR